MNLMHEVAARARQQKTAGRAAEFNDFCWRLLRGGGTISGARAISENGARPTPSGVQSVLKSAVSVADLGESTGFRSLQSAFLDTLKQNGAFDAMLSSMVRVEFGTRILFASTAATGTLVEEGAPKPISRIVLAADKIERHKASAIVVVSNEQLKLAVNGTMGLIGRDLRRALNVATDTIFLQGITPDDSPSPIITSTDPLDDLAAALAALSSGADSRLFIVAAADTAKMLATANRAETGRVFPLMSPTGGEIAGMQVIVSDGMLDGTYMLVDASAIVAAAEPIRLDMAQHATIQMDDDPDSGPVELTSLWQTDCSALRVERWFGWYLSRDDAVAVVENVDY